MALIKCCDCGKEYSDKASACPNCACPNEKKVVLKEKNNLDEKEKSVITLRTDIDYINSVKKILLLLLAIFGISLLLSKSMMLARVLLMAMILPIFIVLIYYIGLITTKNNKVELTTKRIKGQIQFLFNEETINIPLDRIDNIYIVRGFMGVPTLCISSNSSIKKVRYAKEPEEFCDKALEIIEKYKSDIYRG